jgi:hypothetical protein
MTNEPDLRPASVEEVTQSLSFALRLPKPVGKINWPDQVILDRHKRRASKE